MVAWKLIHHNFGGLRDFKELVVLTIKEFLYKSALNKNFPLKTSLYNRRECQIMNQFFEIVDCRFLTDLSIRIIFCQSKPIFKLQNITLTVNYWLLLYNNIIIKLFILIIIYNFDCFFCKVKILIKELKFWSI